MRPAESNSSPDLPPPDVQNRHSLPWYRRWMPGWRTITVIAFVMLATPLAIRWSRLARLPDVPLPFDLEEFSELPADEDNAYVDFGKAVLLLAPMGIDNEVSERWNQGLIWSELPETLQTAVVKQGPALELYRRGARRRSASLIPPQKYSVAVILPVAQEVRSLQRAAYLESLRLMHEDRPADAAELLHDGFRASRHLGRRGCIIERLIGIACHSTILPGWRQWSRRPDVTAEEIETALARIRDDWQLTPPPSDQLKVECLMVQNETKLPMTYLRSQFDSLIVDRMIRDVQLSPQAAIANLNAVVPNWQVPVLWVIGEPELTARSSRLFVTHELNYCDLPFHEQPPLVTYNRFDVHDGSEQTAGLTAAELSRRIDSTLVMFLNIGNSWMSAIRREAATQALLETELELQIRLRRGGAVTRDDMERIAADFPWPIDPCSGKGETIQFRASDDGLVIWSRGWDGVDQGGKPAEWLKSDDVIVTIPWSEGKAE